MCGIAGLLAPGADPRQITARVKDATGRLKHRGPDDEGFYEEGPLCLGHRRLVVIDPTGGIQPWKDEEGRLVCVFNGEIYNHKELRKSLEAEGEKFRTRSDTEVLAKAFIRWKEKAFDRLDGMFAAAFWSPKEKLLTLARDRAGEKPLFFFEGAIGQKGFGFSSEVFSLLALLDQTPAVDPA
ncbi:MAG: asparagine synthetase B, partial [Bdellovibrionota bacterium]